jgi:hypothetical protein
MAMDRIYRICFFKKLVDSTGHPVDACQGDLQIRASAQERAIEDARLLFAKRRDIRHWSLHADYETVEVVSDRERASYLARAMAEAELATFADQSR